MNRVFALSQGREWAFFDIIKPRDRGSGSANHCYSHQVVGMGLLKHLSKEGFGREP